MLRPNLRRAGLVAFGFAAMIVAPPASAESYLDVLIAHARELHLHERREWNRLMHYSHNAVLPGVHGLADAPDFYLAADGKRNPRAELEATLANFFSTVDETDSSQNPQCKFIARYAWLKRELGFDASRLPEQPCKRFREWRETLNPAGVTLVFPAAFLNNPSSMYGHTLMRIDARDQDERTRLLAYAVNFTANTRESNGMLFAINGLIGTYPGTFSIMPYYLKVREYNDLENRDIWEYELDLTPEEIDRLLMHIWELGPVWFNYFFFDENCAYYLLEVLEVARPTLDLSSGYRWWAIPADTVRTVAAQPGLLRRAVYRPSNATVLLHRIGTMSAAERELVKESSIGKAIAATPAFAALPPPAQARVLEVSLDYSNYLRATGHVPKNDATSASGKDFATQSRELMLARSRVNAAADDPPLPVPAVRPDEGHGSARLAVGGGRRDGIDFVELRARPAYHELMDPEAGYVRGAQIEFFDFALRHYDDARRSRVEEFKPVKIVSISPQNDFFAAKSWNVDVGWARQRTSSGAEPLVFALSGGAGVAREVPDALHSHTLVYGFFDAGLRADRRIERGYALGAGPSMGLIADFTPNWRIDLNARGMRFFAGDIDTAWALGLRQRYTLVANSALRFDVSRERQAKRSWNAAQLSLQLYF